MELYPDQYNISPGSDISAILIRQLEDLYEADCHLEPPSLHDIPTATKEFRISSSIAQSTLESSLHLKEDCFAGFETHEKSFDLFDTYNMWLPSLVLSSSDPKNLETAGIDSTSPGVIKKLDHSDVNQLLVKDTQHILGQNQLHNKGTCHSQSAPLMSDYKRRRNKNRSQGSKLRKLRSKKRDKSLLLRFDITGKVGRSGDIELEKITLFAFDGSSTMVTKASSSLSSSTLQHNSRLLLLNSSTDFRISKNGHASAEEAIEFFWADGTPAMYLRVSDLFTVKTLESFMIPMLLRGSMQSIAERITLYSKDKSLVMCVYISGGQSY